MRNKGYMNDFFHKVSIAQNLFYFEHLLFIINVSRFYGIKQFRGIPQRLVKITITLLGWRGIVGNIGEKDIYISGKICSHV